MNKNQLLPIFIQRITNRISLGKRNLFFSAQCICCVRLINMLRIAHSFGRQFSTQWGARENTDWGSKGKTSEPSHGRRRARKGDGKSDVEEPARERRRELMHACLKVHSWYWNLSSKANRPLSSFQRGGPFVHRHPFLYTLRLEHSGSWWVASIFRKYKHLSKVAYGSRWRSSFNGRSRFSRDKGWRGTYNLSYVKLLIVCKTFLCYTHICSNFSYKLTTTYFYLSNL